MWNDIFYSTEFVIYILERPASGPARRIPSNETTNFLNGQLIQLKSKLVVENIVPKMGFTEQALKEYLDTPQEGTPVDRICWF